jgi:hypothetical protein
LKKNHKKLFSNNLLEQLTQLSGLSSQIIKKELQHILEKKNIDPDKITLEQLRMVVASYVRDIMHKIACNTPNSKKNNDSVH